MNITLNQQKINETQSSLEIVILNKIKYLPIELKELLNNINFFKKSFNTHYDIKNNKLYVSCLKLKDEELKTAFASAIRFFKNLNIQDIKIDIIQSKKELSIQTIVEGLVLGNYEFLKYKSSNKIDKNSLIEIFIENSFKSKKKLESELKKALIISNSVNYTKDIVNSSPEDYYPQIMAEDAMQIAKSKNITCKIFGEDYLKEKI